MTVRYFLKKISIILYFSIICIFSSFARIVRISSSGASEYSMYECCDLREENDYKTRYKELLDKIAERASWSYSLYKSDLSDSIYMADNGQLDLLYDVVRTDDRRKNGYFFSNYPSSVCYLDLITQKDNIIYNMTDFQNLNGSRIGYISVFDTHKILLTNFFREFGIAAEIVPYESNQDLLLGLKSGDIDCGLATLSKLMPDYKVIFNFGHFSSYYASKNKTLIDELNYSLESLFAENPIEITHLMMDNINPTDVNIRNLTFQERTMVEHMPPYSFILNYQSSDTARVKYKFDYVRQLASITGVKLSSSILHSDSKDYIRNYIYETIPYSISGSRLSDNIALTNIAYILKLKLIASTKKELYDLIRKKESGYDSVENRPVIAISADLQNIIQYIRKMCVPFDYIIVTDTDQAFKDLEKNKYDALVILGEYYEDECLKNTGSSLTLLENLDFEVPVCFAVHGQNSDMVASILNRAIAQIDMNSYINFVKKSVAETSTQYVQHKWMRLLFFVTVAVFIIIVIFILVIFHIRSSRLRHTVLMDDVTMITNMKGFEREASKLINTYPWLIFIMTEINIKNFNYVNNLYGTETGNILLQRIAFYLGEYAQKNRKCIVARGYADNFYLFKELYLDVNSTLDELSNVFKEIQEKIFKEYNIRVVLKSGSVLSESFSDSERAIKDLISRAGFARHCNDESLVRNVILYSGDIKKKKENQERIEGMIDKALEDEEFFVVFQPKTDLVTERICGAEALVRWKSNGVVISPNDFIPVLEQNGYASKLDFYVYEKVFAYIRELKNKEFPLVPISLNISRLDYNPAGFVSKLDDLVKSYNIPKNLVELEIEERFVGADEEILKEMIYMLKAAGFKVSMDDFGSGLSSLNMLSEIPVDIVKIDQAFLRKASFNKDSRIILTSTVKMLKEMGRETVCEGVETKEQVDLLKEIKCDIAQGYYYSKPLEYSYFIDYLVKHI